MADHPDPGKMVAIGGDVVGELLAVFENGDDLVEQLRRRASYIGLSHQLIEELAEMAEGSAGKYLSALKVKSLTIASLAKIGRVLGVSAILYVDPALVREMQSSWSKRDERRVHTKRQVSLGKAQLRRVLKPVASEMGRRGGVARMAKLTIEERRAIGRRGAAVRWAHRNLAREADVHPVLDQQP
jgi:hypothetical protein